MSYFKAKMHQIRFPLGPQRSLQLGSLLLGEFTALPQNPVFKWSTSKGREGREGEEGMGREEGGKGREGEGTEREGNRTTQNLVATPLLQQ